MFDADYPGVSSVTVTDFIAADTPNGSLYAMFPFSIDNGDTGDKLTMNSCELSNTCNHSDTDLINGSLSAMGSCEGIFGPPPFMVDYFSVVDHYSPLGGASDKKPCRESPRSFYRGNPVAVVN